ncbi:hypothetical protein E3N88_04496 [Mikania micrantha]|uniref:Reverse transcriptase Ty1/copia-type domain-containing protein n=1 Tax=Mikania micrantha TaxID=192012 RepID=A0A5N6PWR1_9ASTR|nr:hypothetical protein E3N88_04496 [Mikania micrantha]
MAEGTVVVPETKSVNLINPNQNFKSNNSAGNNNKANAAAAISLPFTPEQVAKIIGMVNQADNKGNETSSSGVGEFEVKESPVTGRQFDGCKHAKTPIEQSFVVSGKCKGDEAVLDNITGYQKLVGKLIYLSLTRPDISYDVQYLSQYMHAPTTSHLQIGLRVLRYLKSSPGTGVLLSKGNMQNLYAYVDADGAKCPVTRRSVTGFCVFFGNSLVNWKSKKQSIVASLSSDFDSSEASLATSQSVPHVPATLSPHALIASPGHS